MNKAFTLDKEFLFNTDIYEITSISIDHNYDIIENVLEGSLDVSGDYRLHEISINKEDFSFKIPISVVLDDNVNLDTVELDVTDFTYELVNGDELHVHLEYLITGELNIIEFEDEKTLDDYLTENEVDIVDLREDKPEPKEIIQNIETNTEYVKYHVHTVAINDSLESICTKYQINIDTLKKYNKFDNLELNMKLIIPSNEED